MRKNAPIKSAINKEVLEKEIKRINEAKKSVEARIKTLNEELKKIIKEK